MVRDRVYFITVVAYVFLVENINSIIAILSVGPKKELLYIEKNFLWLGLGIHLGLVLPLSFVLEFSLCLALE
jgi:hypothetical protein